MGDNAIASLISYPRGDDDTTSIKCGPGGIEVDKAPYCADDDAGMVSGMETAAVLNGIDDTERDLHCPASAGLRVVEKIFDGSRAWTYSCSRIVCGGVTCGPG